MVKPLKFILSLFFMIAAVSVQGHAASAPHVDLIVIDGSINPAVDDFIGESISRAKAGGAQALVIQLDTPGGHLSSTQTIVKKILGSTVPVIVYVAPAGAGANFSGFGGFGIEDIFETFFGAGVAGQRGRRRGRRRCRRPGWCRPCSGWRR